MVSHHWLVLLLKLLTKSSDTELRKPVWNYEAIATEKNNPINVMNSHILLWRQWQIKTRIVSSFGVSYRYPQLELVEVMEFQLSDFKFSNSSWTISNPERWRCESAALNIRAQLENSAVATRLEKVRFHSIPKKGNAKECSNYHTIALISHASKVMLKILQARLQQYMNHELPDVQAGFRKGRGTRD